MGETYGSQPSFKANLGASIGYDEGARQVVVTPAQYFCSHEEVTVMANENEDPSISHKEFFEKALTAAGEWTRFADPKALGVAVFLGFGATDLLKYIGQLYYGFWLTIVCLLGALLLAVLTLFFVTRALFPRLEPEGPRSLYYFGGIAQFEDPEEYERVVKEKTPQELESHIASQARNVAKVANAKHQRTQWAYRCLLEFLALWAVGRVALYLVS